MAYLNNMPATCKARATAASYGPMLVESIQREFEKGMNGGIFDTTYVLNKIASLRIHVEWLDTEARKERQKELE